MVTQANGEKVIRKEKIRVLSDDLNLPAKEVIQRIEEWLGGYAAIARKKFPFSGSIKLLKWKETGRKGKNEVIISVTYEIDSSWVKEESFEGDII